ncbi:uncharacterized protein N7469_005512 [Penicillium citrinum]|uniref:Letm1 RBD domain-containing protein n=2 Tax=Penicillium TaxID=5073 RepID=A0A9W9P1J0_PENCI|nr:uncharacterized protein N7469_005512 [Penicillium citrinum]KAJ5233746.1 hypothetical protein N7469_005512 [Penicillium citrinum]KAJ5572784.1 hypothetical protein N7450_009768 [Penicillium hetheringtonii]KAK5790261.1 hypothetical protein VI817_007548 [Penicillium citrinum]
MSLNPIRLKVHANYTPFSPLYPSITTNNFSTSAIHRNKSNTSPATTTTTTTVSTPTKSEINAPLSTFPAEIETPPQLPQNAPATDKIKRLVATGRAYVTFYKTGLKNVFRNYRASLPLRKSLGLPTYLPVSPPRANGAAGAGAGTGDLGLGRGQYQLVRRSARDVRRMIPFTLILLICGEFTPLIIPIFGSAITPATCRVPGQINKERETASKRKVLALTGYQQQQQQQQKGVTGSQTHQEIEVLVKFAEKEFVESANMQEILRASAVFGLVKNHTRPLAGVPGFAGMYRRGLKRHVEYLGIDDGMIRKGGVRGLSSKEVRFALEERGLGDVGSFAPSGKVEGVERETLEKWLDLRK